MKLTPHVTASACTNWASATCRYLSGVPHSFRVESVRHTDQLLQACRILYCKYRRRGYCEENDSRLFFSPYMFSEASRTFVLQNQHSVLGTVSVFQDDAGGVPVESLISSELKRLRDDGARVVEVGLLATDLAHRFPDAPDFRDKDRLLPIFLLFKIAFNFALYSAASHLLIAVHPKHRKLYGSFGFRQFSAVKSYHGVCDNPALPMILDVLDRSEHATGEVKQFFLSNPFSSDHFSRRFEEEPDPFATLLENVGCSDKSNLRRP